MATALCNQAQHKEQLVPHQQQQRHLQRSPIKKLQQLAARKERQITSLLVVTQVLRLLLSLVSDPAATHTASHFRSQLMKELEAAAAAACLDGDQQLTALTLLKHLPASRLQQLREAARQHPRKHSKKASSKASAWGAASSTADGRSQASSSSSARQLLPGTAGPAFLLASGAQPTSLQLQYKQLLQDQQLLYGVAAAAAHAPAAPPQQQQQQPDLGLLDPQLLFEAMGAPVMPMDVGCLLETTLVVAAAEAQINSLSFEPPGSNSLQDDACSKVNIEGVLLEEFELAQLNGLV